MMSGPDFIRSRAASYSTSLMTPACMASSSSSSSVITPVSSRVISSGRSPERSSSLERRRPSPRG
jgi:hypothetical protein